MTQSQIPRETPHRCPDSARHHLRTPAPGLLARRSAAITASAAKRLSPLLARRVAGRTLSAAELAGPLRRMCDDLGATFVKFGQIVASSPSLFGDQMAAEFRACLDTGPAVPVADVRAQVERGIGVTLETCFEQFDEEPVGQASLAVVHRAQLHGGAPVAVKVLRPGIEATIAADLLLMRALFRGLASVLAPGLGALLVEAIDGLREQLEEELDLRNEAKVMTYFRALPEHAQVPLVVVPEPYLELTSRRVLVMEFLDGVPVDDLRAAELGIEAAPLVEQLVKAWLLTALRGGIFHGDTHAGNILLLRDGRVGLIDWGIVGRLPPDSHWLLRRFIAGCLGDEAAWDEIVLHIEGHLSGTDGLPSIDRATLRMIVGGLLADVVNKPFGAVSLSSLLTQLQRQVEEARRPEQPDDEGAVQDRPGALGRLRRIGAFRPPPALLERGMLLLAKQLAYFERYGTMYLGEVAVLQDADFFRSALAAGPLDP